MARVVNGGSRFVLLAGLIGALAALVTAVAATASDEVVLWVSDLTTVVAAGAATVFCLRARARLRGAVRRFWALLAAARAPSSERPAASSASPTPSATSSSSSSSCSPCAA